MPHFTRPKLAIYDRREAYLQGVGYHSGNLFDGNCLPASDIHGFSIELVRSRGKEVGPRDVLDKAEITRLPSIFVNYRRQVIE